MLSKNLPKDNSVTNPSMNEEGPPPYSQATGLQFSDPGPPTTHTITGDQCIAHLKLLWAFAQLRIAVSDTDGLFGIHNSQAERFLQEESKSLALARIREKRWAIYTSRALDRYATWWLKSPFPSEEPITTTDLRTARYSKVTEGLNQFQWQSQYLPPLDVLMVWHCHVLNPHTYLEDCLRAGKLRLWSTEFPWEVIDSVIGWDTMEYMPEDEARVFFQKQTGRLWDNQDEPLDKDLDCLCCSKPFKLHWTSGDIGPNLEEAFSNGTGYADNSFDAPCPSCSYKHSAETMIIGCLRQDIQNLAKENKPLPGSLLNAEGLPDGSVEYSFPNRVFSTAKVNVLKVTTPTPTPTTNSPKRSDLDKSILAGEIGSVQDMLSVRRLIELTIASPSVMAKANGGNGTRLSVEQKTSMRKMMAHYWENSSIFGLDLVGAVMRQGTFIQKMHGIDWLHSPTKSATISKLIRKYTVFFDIMVKYKKPTAPTLDVDLAWHTHQLSPSRYFRYSRAQSMKYGTEIFVNHDDKVDEGTLSESFQWTCKTYATATNGEVYSECTCWYCEAVREATTQSRFSFIKSSSSSRNARSFAANLREDSKIPSNRENTPHISAHTAVSIQSPSGKSRAMAKVREIQLRATWEKAHRRAQKSGNAASNEHSDAYPSQLKVWGHSYPISFYAPYMRDASINKCLYVNNPSCRNAGERSYGNCAAGLSEDSGTEAATVVAMGSFQ